MNERIVEIYYDEKDVQRQKWKGIVTRCMNCQEWHPREATDYGFCIRWGQYTKGSDYCSYGK